MKTISVLNEKGGVGKTTVAIHLAAGLAIRGHRVLLVDADAQGHASIAFGFEKEPSFYDFLVRESPFRNVIKSVSPARYALPDESIEVAGTLALIPSNAETRNIASSINDGALFRNRLAKLQTVFDYVIIDTAPTPSLLHAMILLATDYVIVPTKCERWSFDGLIESIRHLQRTNMMRKTAGLPDVQIMGIVPTLYRARTVEHSENLKELRAHYGDTVWKEIPQRTIWAEVTGFYRSMFSVAPTSKASADMWALIDHVEEYVNAFA